MTACMHGHLHVFGSDLSTCQIHGFALQEMAPQNFPDQDYSQCDINRFSSFVDFVAHQRALTKKLTKQKKTSRLTCYMIRLVDLHRMLLHHT